jgi:hypothetical protein
MLETSTTLDAGIVNRQSSTSSIVDVVDPPALLEDLTGPYKSIFCSHFLA